MLFTAALVLSNAAAAGVCSGGAIIYGEEGASGYSDGTHMAADLALLFPKVTHSQDIIIYVSLLYTCITWTLWSYSSENARYSNTQCLPEFLLMLSRRVCSYMACFCSPLLYTQGDVAVVHNGFNDNGTAKAGIPSADTLVVFMVSRTINCDSPSQFYPFPYPSSCSSIHRQGKTAILWSLRQSCSILYNHVLTIYLMTASFFSYMACRHPNRMKLPLDLVLLRDHPSASTGASGLSWR